MLQRAISGSIFVVIVVGCIWWHPASLGVLLAILVIGGLTEFYRLAKKAKVSPQPITGVLAGATFLITHYGATHFGMDAKWQWLTAVVAIAIPISELYRKSKTPFQNIAWTLFGILWVAVPFTLLNDMKLYSESYGAEYDPQVLLGYFFLLWTSDTCAYLSGKTFGKHKLFERISPGKTWEGSIGGTILTVLIAWVVSMFFDGLETWQWMVMAALVAMFGTLGDLTESMFKRSIGVKDSGNIMPGHGGFLDRFDGVFISAPLVVVFLQLTS